jgi:hypothetical protein
MARETVQKLAVIGAAKADFLESNSTGFMISSAMAGL